MRPTWDLQHLERSAHRRIDYLYPLVPPSKSQMTRISDREVMFTCVEAANIWVNFSRSLFISTCQGARTARGNIVGTSQVFADRYSIMFEAARLRKSSFPYGAPITHREEPNWISGDTLIKLLRNVGAANEVTVSTALSSSFTVLRDLPTVRNFYSHRAENTWRKVENLALRYGVPARHPTEFCVSVQPGRPQDILRDWLSQMRLIVSAAVQ